MNNIMFAHVLPAHKRRICATINRSTKYTSTFFSSSFRLLARGLSTTHSLSIFASLCVIYNWMANAPRDPALVLIYIYLLLTRCWCCCCRCRWLGRRFRLNAISHLWTFHMRWMDIGRGGCRGPQKIAVLLFCWYRRLEFRWSRWMTRRIYRPPSTHG